MSPRTHRSNETSSPSVDTKRNKLALVIRRQACINLVGKADRRLGCSQTRIDAVCPVGNVSLSFRIAASQCAAVALFLTLLLAKATAFLGVLPLLK